MEVSGLTWEARGCRKDYYEVADSAMPLLLLMLSAENPVTTSQHKCWLLRNMTSTLLLKSADVATCAVVTCALWQHEFCKAVTYTMHAGAYHLKAVVSAVWKCFLNMLLFVCNTSGADCRQQSQGLQTAYSATQMPLNEHPICSACCKPPEPQMVHTRKRGNDQGAQVLPVVR